jgi:hypothetical protein
VNVETKKQSKQWMQTSRKSLKNIAYQKANGNCFLGQEKSAVSGIQTKSDHNSIRMY